MGKCRKLLSDVIARTYVREDVEFKVYLYETPYFFFQVCWKNWLIGCPEFTITPDTKFSDIIVPTIDNIRSSCILEMLLTNKKSVSFIIFYSIFRHLVDNT